MTAAMAIRILVEGLPFAIRTALVARDQADGLPCAIASTGRSAPTDPHGPRSPRAAGALAPGGANGRVLH